VIDVIRLDTPLGPFVIGATETGVLYTSFGDHRPAVLADEPERLDGALAAPAAHQFEAYFAGRRRTLDLPIDWRLSKGFALAVRRALTEVGWGEVVTYGELARRAEHPGAARAVGTAMATNPLPVVVPCHRVLAANGHIGGYSGSGGVDTKRWLLRLEGVSAPR
jgi:methylated-DNA-[protein]-cysteine S-methyltransferase